ncbi:MAG: sulfate adenylyltransferase [Eubacterium sp.]|nr:sulfate adenylyltransferase [Eubacterium sp.]
MNGLLKFITCGSVDDGKSTLIGHILYDSKLIYADQEKALILDSKVGSRGGKIDYSLLLDGLMAEREQGITIDVAYRYFTTEKRSFIVADTPGHEQYTRNMAVGASFADFAVILIDATQGVLVQTRRHARICALMGIRYFAFAVNKMDLVDYKKERFDEILSQIEELKKELDLFSVKVIPVSATEGDNITKKSSNMEWYDGPALLSYLEDIKIDTVRKEEGFYMPVQRVCRPDRTFRGFQGQIEAGDISLGEEVIIIPTGEHANVKSIYIGDKEANSAAEGRPVTISLDREVDVSRGCVITKDLKPHISKSFLAKILWMDDNDYEGSGDYIVKIGTKQMPGVIREIRHKVDVNTGEFIEAFSLKKNELALVSIDLQEAVVLDEFESHRTLGELILIDRVTNMTSACGVVTEVESDADRQGNSVFTDGILKAAADVFDEYFFERSSKTIRRISPKKTIYNIGDELPIEGESYKYPNDFDIVSENAVIKIRGGVFTEIIKPAAYENAGAAQVSPEGFAKEPGGSGTGFVYKFETYRNVVIKDKLY